MNLSLRHMWIVLFVTSFVFVAWMFRYDVTPLGPNNGMTKHDRWTGTTEHCSKWGGEGPYHCS